MRIKADLRALADSQPTTYLTDKHFAGETSFIVSNVAEFAANAYILIGTLGLESTELAKISSISSETITLTSALVFDHPQDTPVTNIGYNQIAFFYSSTVAGTLSALGTAQNITPDNFYNFYDDTNHTTGFGWFQFYNSTTTLYSDLSNAVPYAGFDQNSVKRMLDRFYTQISNRERKLIRDEDVIEWLNEAYAIARNRLNLTNREYTVPTPQTLTISSGTAEYALPDYYAHTRVVTLADGTTIDFLSLDEVPLYNAAAAINGATPVKYYIRGSTIGFAPTPTASATYYHYYQKISPVLATYIDYIDLPNNNFYFLLDWLKYRAVPLIGGDPKTHYEAFNNGLEAMTVTSHKRDGDPERFGIDPHIFV